MPALLLTRRGGGHQHRTRRIADPLAALQVIARSNNPPSLLCLQGPALACDGPPGSPSTLSTDASLQLRRQNVSTRDEKCRNSASGFAR